MRGRSLRLDPADPEKVASNWDVVCVAPDLARGERRLRALRAQAPAPVRARRGRRGRGRRRTSTPSSARSRPPPASASPRSTAQMVDARADRDAARARWRIGAPYRGRTRSTTLVLRRAGTAPPPPPATPPQQPPRIASASGRSLGGAGASPPCGALAGARQRRPVALAGLADRRRARRRRAARARAPRRASCSPLAAPLDRIARAVTEAYVELGELRPEAAASLVARAARVRLPALRAHRGDARGGRARRPPPSTRCSARSSARATSSRA